MNNDSWILLKWKKNTHTKLNQKQNVFLLSKTVETVKTTKNSNEKKALKKQIST